MASAHGGFKLIKEVLKMTDLWTNTAFIYFSFKTNDRLLENKLQCGSKKFIQNSCKIIFNTIKQLQKLARLEYL